MSSLCIGEWKGEKVREVIEWVMGRPGLDVEEAAEPRIDYIIITPWSEERTIDTDR